MARRAGHVFISYKREEAAIAERLRVALAADGFVTWWDRDIQTGQQWAQALDDAVNTAAAIVVLWSERAVTSKWVTHEASSAITRNVYAPARIELVPITTPFDRVQATDLLDWAGDRQHAGYASLVERLDELIPLPTPGWLRLVKWVRSNASTFALLAVVIAAFWVLARISDRVTATVDAVADLGEELKGTVEAVAQNGEQLTTAMEVVSDVQQQLDATVDAVSELRTNLTGLDAVTRSAEIQGLVEILQRQPCERANPTVSWALRQLASKDARDARDACLRGASLQSADLSNFNLTGADLTAAQLPEADLTGANLTRAMLGSADLERAKLDGVMLFQANLDGANLQGARLRSADFAEASAVRANLKGVRFQGCRFLRTDFTNADLSGADLAGVDFIEAWIDGADLSSAHLEGTRVRQFTSADFSRASRAETDSPVEGWNTVVCSSPESFTPAVLIGGEAFEDSDAQESTARGTLCLQRKPEDPWPFLNRRSESRAAESQDPVERAR